MTAPVLLVADDDRDALDTVAEHLARRYGGDYRVEAAAGGDQAIRRLDAFAERGDDVVLILVAEALAGGPGDGVLEHARQVHPQAKRALLVRPYAFADPARAQAIQDTIGLGRTDYYVTRPEGDPDEIFQHTISTFLLEWAAEQRRVPQTVYIVGESWTGRARELRETFERCAAPHVFCLADSEEGRAVRARVGEDVALPMMVLSNGTPLGDPSNAQIAAAAGTPADFADREFDVIIVGAGPAGLSAAVYGASEGLRTLVVDDGGIGGQARSSSLIRNYLGFPRGVSGSRLAHQAYEQALVFGATFVFLNRAETLDHGDDGFALALQDGRMVRSPVVILATGASYRRLGVPALEALSGAGVFYGGPAAVAHAFAGRDVFVTGGGNSAGQAVLHLASYARRVMLVVRGASLQSSMSRYLIQEIDAAPEIEVRLNTSVVGGGGRGRLEELTLRDATTGEEETVAADALFALIGASPHTEWLPASVARDPQGFVYTGDDVPGPAGARAPHPLETSVRQLLAVGDVRHGSVKRVASAVGEGSVAVQTVHRLLSAT